MTVKTVIRPALFHVGRNVREIREYLGITISSLAKSLGITVLKLREIEATDEIDEITLHLISKALNVSTEAIETFGGEGWLQHLRGNHQSRQGAEEENIMLQYNIARDNIETLERMLNAERERLMSLRSEMKQRKALLVGERIVLLRKLRGMNQAELGKAIGASTDFISRIERSDKLAGEKLEKVLQTLNVTERDLAGLHSTRALFPDHKFSRESLED